MFFLSWSFTIIITVISCVVLGVSDAKWINHVSVDYYVRAVIILTCCSNFEFDTQFVRVLGE